MRNNFSVVYQNLHNISILILLLILTSCATQPKQEIHVLKPFEDMKPVERKTQVAVLLPFKGENSSQSQILLDLLHNGLEDSLNKKISLIEYDCSNDDAVADAMEDIISKKISVILGPLFSATTESISQTAHDHNINILTFSNNPALARDNVFVFGHAPSKQMEIMLDYCIKKGHKNFITLLPAGQYSQTVVSVIRSKLSSSDASLARAEFYAPDPNSITKSVYNVLDLVDQLNENNEDKPIIYIGDSEENLKVLYEKIYEYALDKRGLIVGDSRININFDKALKLTYTGSLNITKLERFKDQHLNYLEVIAYDMGLMTGNALHDGYNLYDFQHKMNDPQGYIVAGGFIKFNQGIAERKYNIIERVGNQYTLKDE
jgi:ABC-type branched-subunit amino acid transport system substrate-binding protein